MTVKKILVPLQGLMLTGFPFFHSLHLHVHLLLYLKHSSIVMFTKIAIIPQGEVTLY